MRCWMRRTRKSRSIERELKRLQEEQRDLIDNLDEVQQRMEQNQDDELADAQEQLEQARDQMEETARNLEQQNLSQAANSGSRASRNSMKLRRITRNRPPTSLPRPCVKCGRTPANSTPLKTS